jgi:TonB family protein
MPSAAQELDNQLASSTSAGSSKTAKKNKGFDIAGPLNNRPIVHKIIPQYPAWAEEQGIIGSVRLYFTVTPEGAVRNNIRVTKTTGYPQLDQLGIDALKQWQFAPVSTDDEGKGEWGIITFNFSLSS